MKENQDGLKAFLEEFDVKLKNIRTIKVGNRIFAISEKMKNFRNFYSAGDYIGISKKDQFKPSLRLLDFIKHTAYKTIVKKKSAWLFLCGRDILPSGIIKSRQTRKGFTLVVDEEGNVLGYGKAKKQMNGILIKNIIDKGDFLRREKSEQF